MVGITDARKQLKYGQSRTEGCLYFMMTALIIGVMAFLFEMLLPGQEFTFGDFTFYISREFYLSNILWFMTFASMIGLFLSTIIIHIHRRTVKKRIALIQKLG